MIIHMRHTLWTGISETNVNVITSAMRTHAFNNNYYYYLYMYVFLFLCIFTFIILILILLLITLFGQGHLDQWCYINAFIIKLTILYPFIRPMALSACPV